MPIEPELVVLLLGVLAGGFMLRILFCSIRHPEKRIWPPIEATTKLKLVIWSVTVAVFGAALFLGLLDWNRIAWPPAFRWGVGLTLIILGNLIVWHGVSKIGFETTSGEVGELAIDGIYAWSRNPQYMADIAILLGWLILSASLWAFPVVMLGIAVLLLAPIAEEPWLEATYGDAYRSYKSRVRRYL